MADIPIIFSAPMVRALIEGRKTQTRRHAWRTFNGDDAECFPSPWQRVEPGDRLWVRENFTVRAVGEEPNQVLWAATYEGPYGGPWRPSIHMPRWASRLTLVVTEVRRQRLQDIDLDDALAEGCEVRQFALFGADQDGRNRIGRIHFELVWEAIHGSDSWASNPEIVALTFTVHRCNIDAMERQVA